MSKKLLSLALSLVMVLALLPAAQAADKYAEAQKLGEDEKPGVFSAVA